MLSLIICMLAGVSLIMIKSMVLAMTTVNFALTVHMVTLLYVEFSWQVIEGGSELDIDFSVKDPLGTHIVQEFRKTDEVHSVSTTVSGIYEFCFDNSFSTIASKTVFADLGFYEYSDDEWMTATTADDFEGDIQIAVMKVCCWSGLIFKTWLFMGGHAPPRRPRVIG